MLCESQLHSHAQPALSTAVSTSMARFCKYFGVLKPPRFLHVGHCADTLPCLRTQARLQVLAHTSTPLRTRTQPHFRVHTSTVPRDPASPSLYPTTALPTGTHVHHTWQRAHIQTPLPPPWLWAPRIRARRAGCSHRQNGSTSAPPPGGRQVQGPRPRPRQAGREGALITRPRGTPPHTPFIPATPDRGPDAHYRLPPGH